jgi:hypothetical protein
MPLRRGDWFHLFCDVLCVKKIDSFQRSESYSTVQDETDPLFDRPMCGHTNVTVTSNSAMTVVLTFRTKEDLQ